MVLCRHEGGIHEYCKQFSSVNNMRKRKNSGLSNVVTDPVSLKVLSWNVAGLAEDCADIFLSQISMLADWDVLLLQECFRKLDGVDVGAARFVHAVRTRGRIAMSGRYRQSEMERTIEDCRGCGKMDCGRAGWTADPHFSSLASQRKKTWRIRVSFDGNPGIREWETHTTRDLGWRLQSRACTV